MAETRIKVHQFTDGTDGELITWDASGIPTTVAVGTAGHVLTSNGVGAAPSFQAIVSPITASNGVTRTGNDIVLGGSLTGATTIAATGNTLTITSSKAGATNPGFTVTNSSTGTAIKGSANGVGAGTGYGIWGTSNENFGVKGDSIGFAGGAFFTSDTNSTVLNGLIVDRQITGGSATNGIGTNLEFRVETTTTISQLSNSLVSKWTNATHADRVSEFSITGVDNEIESTLFTLGGNGKTTLNKYGVGSFTSGTAAYSLQVDASGNIMEGSLSGGTPTLIEVTNDNLTGSTVYPVWTSGASGSQALKISTTKISFNPLTGELTSGTFIGDLTGNASGTSANVTGIVDVVNGGTGRNTSTTAYGLIAAGTTATGVHQTLAAGLTTEILVGGGTSALPVWTTATGSGAPVRAISPTLGAYTATQPSIASVGSGNGTAAGNVATITGAAGGATSANSGTVTGGTGGKIIGTGGTGGAITGSPATGFGGTGGEISFTAGDGGTGTTFGGTGGNANIQAGNGGNGTTPGTGGYASLKAGNGSSSGNSSGGNVFLVGGSKTGSGQDGDIYLGVSPAFAARGKVKIGGSSAPSALLTIGEEGARSGTMSLAGSTSGTITIQPAAAAGTYTLTLPTSDGASGEFLQTNGSGVLTWAAASGGLSDGDYGDITVSSSGTVLTIDNLAVTNAKINDVNISKVNSGTFVSGFNGTVPAASTFNLLYAGSNPAFTYSDSLSSATMFSKDGTQYVSTDNTSSTIGSGTTKMEYIDGVLRLYDSDMTNYIGIQTPATGSLTASYTLTLPNNDGDSGQVLQSDGSGGLSWATIGGDVVGPAGATDNEIVLFNTSTGKLVKAATGTGIVTATAGVYGTVTAPTGTVVGNSDTQTLTNKRIDPRVTATTTSFTPDVSSTDMVVVTGLAGTCTIGAPTGSPVQGTKLMFRIKDNGTARTLTWNAIYRACGVPLPTITVASKTMYVGMIYNNTDTKWDVVSLTQEA